MSTPRATQRPSSSEPIEPIEAAPRAPQPGTRISWCGPAEWLRREGTIVRAYLQLVAGAPALVMDVEWDPPVPGERSPWRGVSTALPVSKLSEPGWEVLEKAQP